jgi:hypothetical protein
LNLRGTGAKLRIIADLVDDWSLLATEERAAVFALVRGPSKDLKWLQGAALTRDSVPDELAKVILPHGLRLNKVSAETLVEKLERGLFTAAARIYLGSRSPLWSLGTHHSGKKVWEPAIEAVAMRPAHPLFNESWQHLMSHGDGKRIARFVIALGTEHGEELFRILMDEKIRTSGWYMPEAWEALFHQAKDEATRKRWLKEMISNAPKVLADLSDVGEWFPKEYRLEVLRQFIDLCYLKILKLMGDVFEFSRDNACGGLEGSGEKSVAELAEFDRETLETYVNGIGTLLKVQPPKILGTYSTIHGALIRFGFEDSALVGELETKRQLVVEERHMPVRQVPEIDSWIW